MKTLTGEQAIKAIVKRLYKIENIEDIRWIYACTFPRQRAHVEFGSHHLKRTRWSFACIQIGKTEETES